MDLYLKLWAEPELGRHNWHCNYVLLPLRWGLEDSSTNSFYESRGQILSIKNDSQKNLQQSDSKRLKYPHPNDVMRNVTVHSPASTAELLSIVSRLDEEIILWNESTTDEHDDTSNPLYPVKLIILDSIAAPTRRDFGGGSEPQRVEAIFQNRSKS